MLQATLGFAPGLAVAGICALGSGRIVDRFGARATLVRGAALFGAAAAWRLVTTTDTPAYWQLVLPAILLWRLPHAAHSPGRKPRLVAAPEP